MRTYILLVIVVINMIIVGFHLYKEGYRKAMKQHADGWGQFERGAHAVMLSHKYTGYYGSMEYRKRVFESGKDPQDGNDIDKLLDEVGNYMASYDPLPYVSYKLVHDGNVISEFDENSGTLPGGGFKMRDYELTIKAIHIGDRVYTKEDLERQDKSKDKVQSYDWTGMPEESTFTNCYLDDIADKRMLAEDDYYAAQRAAWKDADPNTICGYGPHNVPYAHRYIFSGKNSEESLWYMRCMKCQTDTKTKYHPDNKPKYIKGTD